MLFILYRSAASVTEPAFDVTGIGKSNFRQDWQLDIAKGEFCFMDGGRIIVLANFVVPHAGEVGEKLFKLLLGIR